MSLTLVRAERRKREVAEVLCSAFLDDRLGRWFAPGRGNRALAAVLPVTTAAIARCGRVYALSDENDALVAVALVRAPGDVVPALDYLRAGFARLPFVMGPSAMRRVLRYGHFIDHLLSEVHREGPHWYLDTLGVRQEQQARGHGPELVRRILDEARNDGRPWALITYNSRNVSIYRNLGFVVRAERTLPGSDLEARVMTRPATG